MKYDLVLLHAPSVYDFRNKPQLAGPISDVVPSTSVFEMYPIGFTSMAGYLEKFGLRVRIVNLANRMVKSSRFDAEKKIKSLSAVAFGIDLHWLPHAHGSIEVAKLVKKHHPDTPIIFGGLSSTYYHKELLEYDCVDFVVRGDSTEKLMLSLIQNLKQGHKDFSHIPNVSWKQDNTHIYNPLSYVPDDLDEIDVPEYRYTVRSVFKYLNFIDPLPYHGWLQYPNTAVLTARGCTQGCLICGGSRDAYASNCGRKQLAMRSPAKLIEDIQFIQRFSRAPIFILHDIRQGGPRYVDEFLEKLGQIKLKNELVFELFQYADESFFAKINRVVPKYSLEITLETHDEAIRRENGKFKCSNKGVINTLRHALNNGCRKIDLFFMVGIPRQTYESALQNIDFCELIHNECGKDARISYFVAPLAPFLDPASPAFEHPEQYGYKKLCHSLEDHRQALLQPSWKHVLSFETADMSRDDIVRATYESAKRLNEFKLNYGLIEVDTYRDILYKVDKSLEYIDRIDTILAKPQSQHALHFMQLQKDLARMNRHVICGEDELRWEVKKNYANFFSLLWVGMELLLKEMKVEVTKNWMPNVFAKPAKHPANHTSKF